MGSVLDEFERIIPLLNGNPYAKNLMEAFPRIIEIDLQDEKEKLFLNIKDGRIWLSPNYTEESNILASGSSEAFAKVIKGEMDVTHPIASGQISILKGKVSEMVLLTRILWSIKRR